MHLGPIRRFSTIVMLGTIVGVVPCAFALSRATPLGPEGGAVVWINTYPKLLLAGTDNWYSGNLTERALTVWASVDGGDTWRRATPRQRLSLRLPPWDGRVADPHRRAIRYRFNSGRLAGPGRIDVSTDGGHTWHVRSQAVADIGAARLLPLATARTTLLLGVQDGVPNVPDPTYPDGVRRSVDGGFTWRKAIGITGKVRLMRADPTRARTAYAVTETSEDHFALFKSIDGGATWHATGRGLPFASTKGAAPEDLLVTRTNGARLLFATSVGIYRSGDGGANWTRARREYTFRLVAHPTRAGVIFAGTGSGFMRSNDGGRTWHDRNTGLRGTAPLAIAAAGTPSRVYVTGFLGRSTVASSADGGATWNLRQSITTVGFPPFQVVVDPAAPSTAIVPGGSGLKRSVDAGATWRPTGPRVAGVPLADQSTRDIYAFEYVARGVRLIRSLDFGVTWTSGGLIDPIDDPVVASGYIYYPQSGQKRLWRSFDRGGTWSRTAPLPGDLIGEIAVAPSDPKVVYAEWASLGISSSSEGFARSADGGTTWRSMGHPGFGFRSLLVDRRDPDRLYAGRAQAGLWTSGDGGATWVKLSKFPTDPVLLFQPADDPTSLYIGTSGEGAWKVALPG